MNFIQSARNDFSGLIINAAGFTHTSVSIRDALNIFKNPVIEVHISNIYKREEFRQKSLISDVATGGIFGIGPECYNLAIHAINKLIISMEVDKKILTKLLKVLEELKDSLKESKFSRIK